MICEKPFALDAVEAAAMVAAADAAGVTALVGHEFRWAPDRALAARAIADGLIGEPRLATLVQYVPLVADPEARGSRVVVRRGAGRGLVGCVGIAHRRPGAVLVRRDRLGQRDPADGRGARGRRGLVRRAGVVTFGGRDRHAADGRVVDARCRRRLTVVAGTDGTLEIDGDGVWFSDRSGRRLLETPDDLALPPPPDVSDDPRHRYTHLEVGPYTRLCEALRAGIEGRDPPPGVPVPTFADGLACMRVLDAIRASAAAGGSVVTVSS